jgi:hypothetical protein
LIVKQKQAVRIIFNSNYRAYSGPLLKKQKKISLDDLIQYSKIKFMHSYYFNQLPFSLAETWITNNERNPERISLNTYDFNILLIMYLMRGKYKDFILSIYRHTVLPQGYFLLV